MAKYYYHIPTKHILNETCEIDLIDNYDESDEVYYSEAGNALLHRVDEDHLERLINDHKEYHEDLESSEKLTQEEFKDRILLVCNKVTELPIPKRF